MTSITEVSWENRGAPWREIKQGGEATVEVFCTFLALCFVSVQKVSEKRTPFPLAAGKSSDFDQSGRVPSGQLVYFKETQRRDVV